MIIVRIVGAVGDIATPHDGHFLMDWNPHTEYGHLEVYSTAIKYKAKRFAEAKDALDEWNTVSNVQPTRPDGKPNRPLTALSILIEKEEIN